MFGLSARNALAPGVWMGSRAGSFRPGKNTVGVVSDAAVAPLFSLRDKTPDLGRSAPEACTTIDLANYTGKSALADLHGRPVEIGGIGSRWGHGSATGRDVK